MPDNLVDVFFQDKPTKMLIEMYMNSTEPMYGSTLAKRIDCTYSHVIKIVKIFEKYGLINVHRKGRLNLIELTERGRKVAKLISETVSFLSQQD